MKILDLNCQKAYNPNLKNFLSQVIASAEYDFILLQEADEKVLPMIESSGLYQSLGAINPDNKVQSHLRILYRNNCRLESSDFLSFAKMNRLFALRGEPGFLFGVFYLGSQKIVIGSAHLHPGLSFGIRAREMKMVKARLLTYFSKGLPIIFGGDFNLGFPWECTYARKVFIPEFSDATINIGVTLNSLYTEKGNRIDSKIGNLLAKFGIGVKFKTDRIFTDNRTAKQSKITARVLPNRVSDHSPVELILK